VTAGAITSVGASRDGRREEGWGRLFGSAFRNSRNAMMLLDDHRLHVDVNGAYLQLMHYPRAQMLGHPIYEFVAGGPIASRDEWNAALELGDFNGEADLVTADGSTVAVQFSATVENISGHRMVLVVALNTSRWGRRFRRMSGDEEPGGSLSPREREVVRLIALGNTSPEIADELHIAHETVRTHARNAMEKTGARSRAHLVARALGEGLLADVAADRTAVVSTHASAGTTM
jgi:DNA-binding CsgD family transcriptional regulator